MNILTRMLKRGSWCWLLRHVPDEQSSCRTESDLVTIPHWQWCKYCSHNLGVKNNV